MTTRAILTVGLLAILAGCLSLAMLVSQLTGGAVDAALRETNTPDTAQRVTAVCVGLNIGSCRTEQEQEQTPTPTERRDAGGNPWPVIALSIVMLLIAQYLVINAADPWGARGRQ